LGRRFTLKRELEEKPSTKRDPVSNLEDNNKWATKIQELESELAQREREILLLSEIPNAPHKKEEESDSDLEGFDFSVLLKEKAESEEKIRQLETDLENTNAQSALFMLEAAKTKAVEAELESEKGKNQELSETIGQMKEKLADARSQILSLESKNNSNLEEELRAQIKTLESTVENLKQENEMALMVSMEHLEEEEKSEVKENEKARIPLEGGNPVLFGRYEPETFRPSIEQEMAIETQWMTRVQELEEELRKVKEEKEQFIEANPPEEKEKLIAMLWQMEKKEEKQNTEVNSTIESIKETLEKKESEAAALAKKVKELSGKVAPEFKGPDDLQLIKGIGPYIRKLLKEKYDITTFKQVAELTQSQIDEISKKLFFKNKIKQENWMGQAQELHDKKYGEIESSYKRVG
jgi:predicted flap endonuclease-1-like 5' DNA nuclease